MSDQLGEYYSRLGPPRPLTAAEHDIVAKLVRNTPHEKRILEELHEAEVRDMPDGGMGSIQFCSGSLSPSERTFGEEVAEGAFRDADGTPVSVTLDLDDQGNLYELDVFKADGSALIRYPKIDEFEIIDRQGQLGFPPSKVPPDR